MGKYFGTDGFRGEANVTLTYDHAVKIGRFLGWYYGANRGKKCQIVIGKDTRRSSYMFEYALAAGLTASGADAYLMHVTTTPSVSYVTRTDSFDCGIMISASHNPYYDNGIKLLNEKGEKMDEETILKIEDYLDGKIPEPPLAKRGEIGCTVDYIAGRNRYVGYLISLAIHSFRGKRVGLDCANGSSWQIAKAVFDALGAKTYVINAQPDGLNINENCGSTHLGQLKQRVKNGDFDLGVAFDGDADRCLIVDETGEELDGDRIMAVCAAHMKKQGKLRGGAFVATVLSNMGLHAYAEKNGMRIECSNVGDRYVLEMMLQKGYILGGEQSGHVIFLEYASTGDGELTALQFMSILKTSGKKCSEIAAEVVPWPQVMINVKVPNDKKSTLQELPEVKASIGQAASELGENGRILVRPSGTEALVRVMVEGKDSEQVDTLAKRVAKVIESVV